MITRLLFHGLLVFQTKRGQTFQFSPLMKIILALLFLGVALGMMMIFKDDSNSKVEGFAGVLGGLS